MLLEKWDYGRRAPWVTNRELPTGRTAVVKIQENGISRRYGKEVCEEWSAGS
jgi:hypothetical protein